MNKKALNLLLVVGLLVIVGVVSFWGGNKYQKNKIPVRINRPEQFRETMGKNQSINGEITAIEENNITVKTPDGSSQIILLSNSTIYKEMIDMEKSDMSVGKKVVITGVKNNGGSINAIQISIGIAPTQFDSPKKQ